MLIPLKSVAERAGKPIEFFDDYLDPRPKLVHDQVARWLLSNCGVSEVEIQKFIATAPTEKVPRAVHTRLPKNWRDKARSAWEQTRDEWPKSELPKSGSYRPFELAVADAVHRPPFDGEYFAAEAENMADGNIETIRELEQLAEDEVDSAERAARAGDYPEAGRSLERADRFKSDAQKLRTSVTEKKQSAKRRAAFYKHVHDWNQEEATNYYEEFATCSDIERGVLLRLTQDPVAARAVAAKCHIILEQLSAAAVAHDAASFEVLAYLATEFTDALNSAAAALDLEFVQALSEHQFRWPTMHSPLKAFSQQSKDVLDRLQLGRAVYPRLTENPQWDVRSPITRFAVKLFFYLDEMRRMSQQWSRERPALAFIPKVGALPRLDKQCVDQWWPLIEEIVQHHFGEPQYHPVLRTLVSDGQPSRKKNWFWNHLRRSITTIAPNSAA